MLYRYTVNPVYRYTGNLVLTTKIATEVPQQGFLEIQLWQGIYCIG